jgi:OmpA-OmpF porin, OOP family
LNPDERTYDPDAINFMAAPSYTKAAEMYNVKACNDEKRPVVRNGKRTGETVDLCAPEFAKKFALSTWTPGDVTATVSKTARGGLVRVWSTKENSSQMPNAILGIKKWNASHPEAVQEMLAAIFEGGDQVKYHPEALKKASELSWEVYNREESPEYWYKYFLGVEEIDRQGNKVQLGGSAVFNLADNLRFYGLQPGQANLFKNTYELFGGYMHTLYPAEVPRIQPYAEAVNTTYLEQLARRAPAATPATAREYRAGESIGEVSARRDWSIEFETGSDRFTPAALRTLQEMRSNLLANEVPFEIHGHTDSTGTPDGNQLLSEKRAFAVKQWLEESSRGNFPENRMRVYSHGQTQPLVPNTSAANMARNRRVSIVLGR